MKMKKIFKKMRDGLQQLIYKVINPFVYGMIKIGITPNMVTTIGFLGNVLAAALMVYATKQDVKADQYYWMAWSGATIIIFSLFDMLDGQVARLGNKVSRFGAMYDSVLDRYCELFTLGGITYFLMETGYETGAIITFLAMIGSVMVSYVRARAEGLDIGCKIGFMQRPERVVVTSVATVACGVYGYCSEKPCFDPMLILIISMGVIAVFANLTAFARIAHCRRELNK